jgi:6-phosphogluconolactonase
MSSIEVLDDAAQVARATAERFVAAAAKARDRFFVALAGGSTPRATYALLAAAPFRDQVNWCRVEFYFGDERCVPPDHHDSNFKMAQDTLLSKLPITAEQVHRVQGELPPMEAADAYAAELRPLSVPPRFDLILLGMGPDGHTASLFPGTTALQETRAFVTAVYVPKLDVWRVTLTAPVLSAAHEVIVTAVGAEKADALKLALEGPPPGSNSEPVPIRLVQPRSLTFLVDRAAAAKLSPA